MSGGSGWTPNAESEWPLSGVWRLFGDRAGHELRGSWSNARQQWSLLRHRVLDAQGRADAERLRAFRGKHAGERCVIIGNGPSLARTDLSLLKGEATFGLNRIYLKFPELGYATTYHVVINRLVAEQCRDDFLALEHPLFTTETNRPFLESGRDVLFLSSLNEGRLRPEFSRNAVRGVWEGATVTYVAMQLAYFMGFTTVILVGVDHRFSAQGVPHREVVSSGPDVDHFDPGYFGAGFRWQLPDLETSEVAYESARRAFEADDRRIIDATDGGALTVFPKMRLEEALSL